MRQHIRWSAARRQWLQAALVLLVTALTWAGFQAGSPLLAGEGAPAGALPDLAKASWIWTSPAALQEGDAACFFRKTFALAERPARADILITADNGYDLLVNGALVGGDVGFDGIYWSSVERYRIEHLLAPGKNVIAVRGDNLGGPGGLIAVARIELPGGILELGTDASWRVSLDAEATTWASVEYDDGAWKEAAVLGAHGIPPWGKLSYPGPVSPSHAGRGGAGGLSEPGKGFGFPEGILFLRGRVPQSSTPGAAQAFWSVGGSRAYLENDTHGPAALGRRLYRLSPTRPGTEPRLLLDAGKGVIGSPCVSYDGKTAYFPMAPEGESFFHLYRMAAEGGTPVALTRGPFHDFDPDLLPDGRIVFSSTRIGSREEYHGNLARSLFTMDADGSGIRPLTHHIVGDNEPRVTARGEIAFIRCDNFMERAKVETNLHLVRADGTGGEAVLSGNRGALSYDAATAAEGEGRWLRSFGFGSIAPLASGPVACISAGGVVATGADPAHPTALRPAVNLFDLSPLPDGRLLCTTATRGAIGVLEPRTGAVTRLYNSTAYDMLSPVFLGRRPKPPVGASHVDRSAEDTPGAMGTLICQNARYTKQSAADLGRAVAVRVIQAVPFTLRAARHPYVHLGVEAVELGTVPLAADGSFAVRVPADRPLAMQMVDAEGRAVVSEMSWIYVRPGERRTCRGCHEPKQRAPGNAEIAALRSAPVDLLPGAEPHRFRGNNAANGGILNLQFDRFREAASVGLYPRAVAGPGSAPAALLPGRASEVVRLCKALSEAAPSVRVSAARRLGVLRERDAAPALCGALKDPSADVRLASAVSLAACGARETPPALLDALEDPSPAVAQAAHVALSHFTTRGDAFDAFTRPAGSRGAAWRAWLKAYSWDEIERDLTASLAAGDRAAAHQAIEALGHVGGEAGREALRAFVSQRRDAALTAYLAAIRALGYLRDEAAVPLLLQLIRENAPLGPAQAPGNPEFGWLQRPVHVAAAAAESLGRIGGPAVEQGVVAALTSLHPFWFYTSRCGDHGWLMGCHSSPLHYRILEALEAMGAIETAAALPAILRSVPIDTDRALLLENDTYEALTGRVVCRSGRTAEVVSTCLSVLGDAGATAAPGLAEAICASPPAESCGPLGRESRAAQILSVVAADPRDAPRVCAAFDRYRAQPPSRERSWTCFYLARVLGALGDPASVPSLLAALQQDATEASFGFELPPNVFVHKAMTPFYRAAAAFALGSIGDRRAMPALLDAAGSFDNALDVRHAAARALAVLAARQPGPDAQSTRRLRALAADYPEVTTRRVLQEGVAPIAANH